MCYTTDAGFLLYKQGFNPNVKIWLAAMKVENKEISMIHTDNIIDTTLYRSLI